MIVAELFAKLGLVPDHASFEKGEGLIEGLHTALEAYVGYEGLKKVGQLITSTVEAALSAKHLGEQLGITTDAVQELGFAAEASDVPAEVLDAAMRRLAVGMEQAKKGTGPAHDALTKLGVKMQDLKGETLDQNLEVIANAFKKMPDGAQKAALSIELFGRQAGPRMLQLLNKGQEGIVALRNEAEKLGVVMSKEAIEQSEKLDQSQKRLKATLIGVRNEAVAAILPQLNEMASALGEWVKQNREAIASTLEAVLTGIAFAFKVVGGAISFVIDFLNEHRVVLAALIYILGVFVAEMLVGAAEVAIGWALALLPFLAIVGVITAVIYGIKALVEWVTGAEVTWDEMWEGVKAAGQAVLDWFEGLPDRLGGWLSDAADSIRKAFGAAFDWVKEKAHAVWEDIKSFFGDFLNIGTGSVLDRAQELAKAQSGAAAPTQGFVANLTEEARLQSMVNNFGDTHIQIDGSTLTPEEVQKHVADGVREAHKDLVREAHANLAGGKR